MAAVTWRPIRTAPPDDKVYLWYESDGKSYSWWNGGKPHESFATGDKWVASTWTRHSHPANQILLTHWWDGEGSPSGEPAARVDRSAPGAAA